MSELATGFAARLVARGAGLADGVRPPASAPREVEGSLDIEEHETVVTPPAPASTVELTHVAAQAPAEPPALEPVDRPTPAAPRPVEPVAATPLPRPAPAVVRRAPDPAPSPAPAASTAPPAAVPDRPQPPAHTTATTRRPLSSPEAPERIVVAESTPSLAPAVPGPREPATSVPVPAAEIRTIEVTVPVPEPTRRRPAEPASFVAAVDAPPPRGEVVVARAVRAAVPPRPQAPSRRARAAAPRAPDSLPQPARLEIGTIEVRVDPPAAPAPAAVARPPAQPVSFDDYLATRSYTS